MNQKNIFLVIVVVISLSVLGIIVASFSPAVEENITNEREIAEEETEEITAPEEEEFVEEIDYEGIEENVIFITTEGFDKNSITLSSEDSLSIMNNSNTSFILQGEIILFQNGKEIGAGEGVGFSLSDMNITDSFKVWFQETPNEVLEVVIVD